jgi:hypothetical protein
LNYSIGAPDEGLLSALRDFPLTALRRKGRHFVGEAPVAPLRRA